MSKDKYDRQVRYKNSEKYFNEKYLIFLNLFNKILGFGERDKY
jgi:hypothetical protein